MALLLVDDHAFAVPAKLVAMSGRVLIIIMLHMQRWVAAALARGMEALLSLFTGSGC